VGFTSTDNISKSMFSGLNISDYEGAVFGKTLSLLGSRIVEECPTQNQLPYGIRGKSRLAA
jgi:hypothetical protein